jgi:hypothetical protein
MNVLGVCGNNMAEEKLNANDTLSKVLAYVDSPFKLFAVILMAVIAFAGYIIYDHKELIVGTYKESQRLPNIAEDRVDDVAVHLFKTTDATVVAVFKVNPLFGSRIQYRAYTKNGRDKTNDGLDVGLFTSNQANNHDVIALMAGNIPCGEYKSAQSEIGLWYIEKGMIFGCRISVPPDPSRFVGQITVGWDKPPADLEQTKAMLFIAATMLSRSKK